METKTSLFKEDMANRPSLRSIEYFPPEALFAFLAEKPGFIWLDSGLDTGGLGRWSFMTWAPEETVTGRIGEFVHTSPDGRKAMVDDPFEAIKDILARRQALREEGYPPFTGGAAGFFGYGLQRITEPAAKLGEKKPPEEGDIWIGIYSRAAAWDHHEKRLILAVNPDANEDPKPLLDAMESSIIDMRRREALHVPPPGSGGSVGSNFTREGFMAAVEKVRAYIEQGDCYQANIAQRFTIKDSFGPELYMRLRRINPAPFASYVNTGAAQILSISPERFVRLRKGQAQTRPIKGTRPRGKNANDDRRLRDELMNSEKDRAENVMIVDLLRNDLGKVCVPGSVKVDKLWQLEEHPEVFHLVSTVSGKLRPELGAVDLLKNTFPGGSVTGAPKIRAMEIIDEVEPAPRGVYCGAIGYIGFDGSMDTSVVIRTIVRSQGIISFHAGGGITWPSDPAEEYQETLDKAGAMIKAVENEG